MSELHIVKTKSKRKILKPVSSQAIEQNRVEGAEGQIINSEFELIPMLLPPTLRCGLLKKPIGEAIHE